MDSLAIRPVILAGGSGTRLWPKSRSLYPKQFLQFNSDYSLFQDTALRCRQVCALPPIVVCNEEHRFLAAEQLQAIGIQDADILLEPLARNTAPAIALAAHCAQHGHDDNVVLGVFPSDHRIDDTDPFHTALALGEQLARDGRLVTFGIQPERPETGYGYIETAAALDAPDAMDIARFVEKPDADTAARFLAQGNMLWNSGMFLFRADTYLNSLAAFDDATAQHCAAAWRERRNDLDFIRVDAEAFSQARNESIDYAIMERAENRAVIAYRGDWTDLGSWQSVYDYSSKDGQGNSVNGDVITDACSGCYVEAGERLVAAVGLKDIAIVETGDTVLVTSMAHSQSLKSIVSALKSNDRDEVENLPIVYRPWGNYESLNVGARYQVKRITVKPGQKLSLQKHFHRAEHWIVVRGTALVTVGDREILLTENESTYIPLGEMHRLENPGSILLELIEVQSGSYLGEDDIVRFDDVYGRSE